MSDESAGPASPPPAPATAPSATPPAPPPAAPARRDEAGLSFGWTVLGMLLLWIAVAAIVERGVFSGYLLTAGVLYVMVIGAGLVALAGWLIGRYGAALAGLGVLGGWWWIGGSYAPWRDAAVTAGVMLAVLLVVPAGRWWLRRGGAVLRARVRLAGMRRRQRQRPEVQAARRAQEAESLARAGRWFRQLPGRVAAHLADDGAAATPAPVAAPSPPPSRPRRPRLAPGIVLVVALLAWLVASVADRYFERGVLPRRGQVTAPPALEPEHAGLRVGLALSGGGYRAALVHAGVVDALGALGIPVTHLSSVSGGSIVAAYLAQGGAPQDFRDAVAAGRFRMLRDLLSPPNLVRLPSGLRLPGLQLDLWPMFAPYSRVDVQADLVDRVLLGGATPAERQGPRLMVCMTDLQQGLSVGATDDGLLLVGPRTARYLRHEDTVRYSGLERLAERVAVSGAFPGAFAPVEVQAQIAVRAPVAPASGVARWSPPPPSAAPSAPAAVTAAGVWWAWPLTMQLADGGVRDNLGLTLLESMDGLARAARAADGTDDSRPDADWRLDLVLVSDGGKFLQAEVPAGPFGAVSRAIDLSGLATGVLRPPGAASGPPQLVLTGVDALAPSPDAVLHGRPMSALRDAGYAYFRPATLSADVLERLLALPPQSASLQAAWQRHRARGQAWPTALADLGRRCPAAPAAGEDPQCDGWRVIAGVGEDIWTSTLAFAAAPTLEDAYTPEQAATIYRFGQYLVWLRAAALRAALAQAAAARAR